MSIMIIIPFFLFKGALVSLLPKAGFPRPNSSAAFGAKKTLLSSFTRPRILCTSYFKPGRYAI